MIVFPHLHGLGMPQTRLYLYKWAQMCVYANMNSTHQSSSIDHKNQLNDSSWFPKLLQKNSLLLLNSLCLCEVVQSHPRISRNPNNEKIHCDVGLPTTNALSTHLLWQVPPGINEATQGVRP